MKKRFLCLWLPRWPVQRWVIAKPALDGQVLVVHELDRHRVRRVSECSIAAWQHGIRPGMPLAEAAALMRCPPVLSSSTEYSVPGTQYSVPGTQYVHSTQYSVLSTQYSVHSTQPQSSTWFCQPLDTAGDHQGLLELAEFCEQFSPQVGLTTVGALPAETSGDCLFWDVTGVSNLFGGEAALMERANSVLCERGYRPRLGMADTLGTAWAAAHFGTAEGALCLVPPERSWEYLRTWPIEALRLPAAAQSCLHQLGVLRIEQLAVLPRQSTAVRLGMVPFLRLDQALGEAAEAIVAHRPAPHYSVYHWFEHPTASRAAVQQALEFLMQHIARELVEHQQGALELDCRLDCATGTPLLLRLNFFRPTAAVEHWLELADMQFDQTALPGAVHRLALHAARTAPLTMRQSELPFWQTTPHEDSRQLAHLVNRLSNRLGREAVVRPHLCADAQPEQAYEGVPLAGYGEERRRKAAAKAALPAAMHRPLLLHHPPRPLEVVAVVPDGPPVRCSTGDLQFDVVRCWGPERIETGWWRGATVRRDYYRVESRVGGRFWLFRRLGDGHWFLQGEFG